MNFKYKKFQLNPQENPNFKRVNTFRPIVSIDFESDRGNFSYFVLIDSGADFCVFHAEIGERLGIDIKKGDLLTFHGTSGTPQKAYFHNIIFKLGGNENKAYVGFSYEMESLPYGILGQDGFFDKWRIRFEYDKNNIEIKEATSH